MLSPHIILPNPYPSRLSLSKDHIGPSSLGMERYMLGYGKGWDLSTWGGNMAVRVECRAGSCALEPDLWVISSRQKICHAREAENHLCRRIKLFLYELLDITLYRLGFPPYLISTYQFHLSTSPYYQIFTLPFLFLNCLRFPLAIFANSLSSHCFFILQLFEQYFACLFVSSLLHVSHVRSSILSPPVSFFSCRVLIRVPSLFPDAW